MRDNLNYLYTFDGEKYILDYSTLEEIEELLDPKLFYRANRQCIVHINAILKPPLKMEQDVSREKAPAFKRWFDR